MKRKKRTGKVASQTVTNAPLSLLEVVNFLQARTNSEGIGKLWSKPGDSAKAAKYRIMLARWENGTTSKAETPVVVTACTTLAGSVYIFTADDTFI